MSEHHTLAAMGISIDVKGLVAAASELSKQKIWPAAAKAWEEVRRCSPDTAAGYTLGSEALLESREFDECDRVACEGLNRFPANLGLAMTYAWSAHRRRLWPEAISRWQSIRVSYPSNPLGFIHGGSALMAAGRLEEAIELLSNAAGQFAANIDVRITLGWALNRSKKWREAEPLWRALATEFPERDQIWVGLAETLNALRQFEEARVWIDKARLKRPIDAYSTVLEARIAIGQGRWSEAVAKLTEAQVHFPNDVGIRMTLNEAQMRSLLESPEAALPVEGTDAATAPADGDSKLREIFMQFESLGSTCEFGLVQRNFGAEPLGLLRWSVISYKQLMTGLSNRFEGVGLPENTRMKVVRREWYTEDLTYGMGMHTFILENEEPEETLFPKLCKRLQFLRRKLVDDLQCDDKIFVYKSEERLTDTKILALHKEICRDGEKMVLVVVLADNDHQVGTIREIRQGLIIGYLKTFFDPKPVIDPWLRICLSTHAMWQARHAYQSVNRAN